jgi:hypothetical protein
MTCKHVPDKVVTRFEDAWMGTRMSGNYESGRTYTPILCEHCKKNIKANKELTEWVLVTEEP